MKHRKHFTTDKFIYTEAKTYMHTLQSISLEAAHHLTLNEQLIHPQVDHPL
uniref:Uncharacterized protein n=1 Tax=Rhizophora mucronata TaxID=61149 RepID=A0A2P2L9P1_RHIMU